MKPKIIKIPSIKKEMEDSFKTLDEKRAIDVGYLCVKETSSRVEVKRERIIKPY
ncbi:hypothetical protein Taiwan55_06630 [Helicobacter pylori]